MVNKKQKEASIEEMNKLKDQLLKLRFGKIGMKSCPIKVNTDGKTIHFCGCCPLRTNRHECVLNVIAELKDRKNASLEQWIAEN